uniref:Uncharacterized protein n=1 Tax=Cyprinus carpio TaxID=7962 RepID=A0A8C1ZXG7_CYPCA
MTSVCFLSFNQNVEETAISSFQSCIINSQLCRETLEDPSPSLFLCVGMNSNLHITILDHHNLQTAEDRSTKLTTTINKDVYYNDSYLNMKNESVASSSAPVCVLIWFIL